MGQSSPQVSQSGPPAELLPYIGQYLGSASDLASRPYEQYQGPRVAPFTGLQNQAFQGIGQSMNDPGLSAAQGFTYNMLNGAPGSNPYLNGILSAGQDSIKDAYSNITGDITHRFNSPGSWGGSAHALTQEGANKTLAKELGNLEQQVRYGDFNNSLNRQMTAAPLAMQLAQGQQGLYQGGLGAGNLQQSYGQALMDSMYGDWNNANNYGWQQLGHFGTALGTALGNAGTQQTTQEGNNPWGNALGLGLLGYSLFPKP